MYGKLSSGLVSSLSKLLKFRFFFEDDGREGTVEEGKDLLPFFITSLLK